MPAPHHQVGGSGPSSVVITQYRPHQSGALQGFATVETPSGFTIHGVAIFEKGGNRWTKLPGRRWKDRAGEWREEPLLEIPDRDRKDKFDRAVLVALDQFTGEVR